MKHNDNTMYIELFGDFIIHMKGEKLHMHEALSKQTMSLLEVLIIYYGRSVPKERLMDLLWMNNDNPDSALKFNVFRLRKLLRDIPLLENMELIHTDRNGYRFDPGVDWGSDLHTFEELHGELISRHEYDACDYDAMNTLLNLYQGPLYHTHTSIWFTQREEYCHNIYLRYISPLCEHYLKNKEYDEMKRTAQKAVTLAPSVENNHYYLILSHIRDNESITAYECYQKAVRRLSDDFDMVPSKRLTSLYHDVINENNQKMSPDEIMNHYRTRSFNGGAFYCSGPVFDYLYEMRLRSAKREEGSVYLYVFELDASRHESLDDGMKKLKECFFQVLRSSDVFTKLNRSQFLVLLTCPSKEIAFDIAQRISTSFHLKVNHTKNCLHYHLCQVND